MTLKEFGEAVEYNIEHDLKYAVLGLGAPGVGKSQIIRQIGRKYGYKVIDIRLAQMSEVEIGGLIYPNESRTKTVWLAPEILPNEERDGKHTILLLDEITSCTKRVQVAAYQLILDRRIGEYTLPDGCFVVALGNNEDDEGVYVQLAAPLADRFEIHYIDPDFDSWKNDYALKAGVHPLVVSYLTMKPAALHTQKQEAEGSMRFATPRSWDRISDILHHDSDVNKKVIQHKIIGNIGMREALQFIEFCKENYKKFVSADDYLSGAPQPEDPEMLSMLTEGLANKLSFLSDKRSLAQLSKEETELVQKVIAYLFKLQPSEYCILGMKRLMEINRPLVKQLFLQTDDSGIMNFILKNGAAMGLAEAELSDARKKHWLKLWQ